MTSAVALSVVAAVGAAGLAAVRWRARGGGPAAVWFLVPLVVLAAAQGCAVLSGQHALAWLLSWCGLVGAAALVWWAVRCERPPPGC